jgi:sialate O-acetylesterase
VQIANFRSSSAEDWPAVREGQRQVLALQNTGMAVTIDIGNPDDVHPLNKRSVGGRLALIARATVYGEHVQYSGPLVRELTRESGALRVWFTRVGGGLQAHGGSLTAFEIAGSEGKFHAAEARIDGDTVLVSANDVKEPVAVRYGWANSPACNYLTGRNCPHRLLRYRCRRSTETRYSISGASAPRSSASDTRNGRIAAPVWK